MDRARAPDGAIAVTLGVHHGIALRWRLGSWPGDAALTPRSAHAICHWIAGHGCHEPLAELEASRR